MKKQGNMMDGRDYMLRAFGYDKNPSVTEVKDKAEELIDLIIKHGNNKRRTALACTGIEQATMMAVKSIFTPEEG